MPPALALPSPPAAVPACTLNATEPENCSVPSAAIEAVIPVFAAVSPALTFAMASAPGVAAVPTPVETVTCAAAPAAFSILNVNAWLSE